LDRQIAEAGRFPAVDIVKSVSRSLPETANDLENTMIMKTKRLMATYERSKTMIKAGLYSEGSDPVLDQAVRIHEEVETLLSRPEPRDTANSFQSLQAVLRAADAYSHANRASKTP